MGVGDIISGLILNVKNDKSFLARIIVAAILIITSVILGATFMIRMWVYQSHHRALYALEGLGYGDPNYHETFPQFTFCPGYINNTQTGHPVQGVITSVTCDFHDITPKDPHNPESTEKTEEVKPIRNIRGPRKHVIDFRDYNTCYDVNFVHEQSPRIHWQDSHSAIFCRVYTNAYVHTHVYGFHQHRPSHVLNHYTNIKDGEGTSITVRAEEASHYPGVFYEIDRKDEEMRFQHGRRVDHLWVSFSFSRFTRRRYQEFHGTHTYADVTIGMIGGFCFLFFILYRSISTIAKLFSPSYGVSEEQPLVK